MARISDQEAGGRNVLAFLDMIAVSEGTDGQGDDGYNVVVGHTRARPSLFTSYADHPRKLVAFKYKSGAIGKSTAAGRYQTLARYYDAYRKQLGLKDFSPVNQDRIALQMIRECKALGDIQAGRFAVAVRKCRGRWASLPGAGYGQHENSLAILGAAYIKAGGVVA